MITGIERTAFVFTSNMLIGDGIEIEKASAIPDGRRGPGVWPPLEWAAVVSGWPIYFFSVDADVPSDEDVALVEGLIRMMDVTPWSEP